MNNLSAPPLFSSLPASVLARLKSGGWSGTPPALVLLGTEQRLYCIENKSILGVWPVSTGAAGFGNRENSGRTPTGLHRIHSAIGHDAPLGMAFKGRQATGEIILDSDDPTQDHITTRILWLEGLEPGFNQGTGVDTYNRYIYIHGTPQVSRLGQPASAGCVRMSGEEICHLFPLVGVGTLVLIIPSLES
ncbi:MAG: L,D-transpeptidase [Magnetococcus sp. DMHC-6]